jgi:hypothetical protein
MMNQPDKLLVQVPTVYKRRGKAVPWKIKAFIQRVISMLPSHVSYEAYYKIQRTFGSLRSVSPMDGIREGLRIVNNIEEANRNIEGKVFLEVGTGRRINVPITLWLCGAGEIITLDLNPYLKVELIREDIEFIRRNQSAVCEMFGRRANQKRFQQRFRMLVESNLDVEALMKAFQIKYTAPSDARWLPLAEETIDFHVSIDVFEHIPPDTLQDILVEGKRVMKDDGLFVHLVDFSDHFAHADPQISTVNFLQYSEREWMKYANNRYMYHNRLRIDEFERIVRNAGLKLIASKTEIDANAVRLIESGFKLDHRFADKTAEINATKNAWIIARKPLDPK